MPDYLYGGAKAMVAMHEREQRAFLETWRRWVAGGGTLSDDEDPDYASPEALLYHVLSASRSEMLWICKQLDLPDPEIAPAPVLDGSQDLDANYEQAHTWLEHLLERWREPLKGVKQRAFYIPSYPSGWEVQYCIDSMLEHAVMHPLRHRFQLEAFMNIKGV
jgi:hypothetical protein